MISTREQSIRSQSPSGWLCALMLLSPCTFAVADPMNAEQRAFFEAKIRPVLVKQCYSCHSPTAKKLGGKLLLDSRDGMLDGGQSGPSVVAGSPEESLIIQALRYDGIEMPPKERLPEAVVSDFEKWVRMGAPDPRGASSKTEPQVAAKKLVNKASLWSLKPNINPSAPKVQAEDWCRDPMDRFVLAKMEEAKLKPADDATPGTLLRRVSYDLIGLPPSLEQVESFVTDFKLREQPALERVVDVLLASPQFGERWGRHWLDVARYGESNGNDGLSRNPTFPHAWRYRDYVIQAFNNDTPFDRFITEQIAGDLLETESDAQRDRLLIATGFLALGSKPARAMNDNFDMDVVADQIDVVSRGFMGLTVACARCHDHKHDPIPTSDYYAMAGIFSSTETLWGNAANEKLTAPATPLHELKTAAFMKPPPMVKAPTVAVEGAAAKKAAKPAVSNPSGKPLAMGVRERAAPADSKINIGGESKKLGPGVPRGFLTACTADSSQAAIDPKQSGRLQMAQWLTSNDHPLTARVMVNRLWLHLFGQGIVQTPDDFGVYGARPTHPELLDHLASRFMAEGWSVKRMIRAMVLSRTYQLSSQCDEKTLQADPENQWLARHKRTRLDAESLRDSILAASGELDVQPGQGSIIQHMDVLVNKSGSLHQPSNHRSVYLLMLRNSMPPEVSAFNIPDGITVEGKRDITTLPTQALFLLNNAFLVEQSQRFASRVLASRESSDEGRIYLAYRMALKREPAADEMQNATSLLKAADDSLKPSISVPEQRRLKVWATLCQALMASNEFRYID